MGISAPGTSLTPATTVVGPDAYGAAAAVGTQTGSYALPDHNHGLPAAPSPSLTSTGAILGGDYGMAAATAASILVTASLAVGTWLVSMSAELINGGATAGDAGIWIASGTAVATIIGPSSSDGGLAALTGAPLALGFTCIVGVTTAGTMNLMAKSSVLATVKATGTESGVPVTGYTAIKIA